MSLPPNPPPGQGPQSPWYPTSANGSGSPYSSGVPSQPGPHHTPPNGDPYSTQYGLPPGQSQPPALPPSGSGGGGVVKWLVIGCLGCIGIAVIGFLALVVLAMIDGPSDSNGSDASPTSAVESGADDDSGASDAGGDESTSSEAPAGGGADSESSEDSDDTAAGDPAGAVGETDAVSVAVVSTERTQELSDSLWESTTDNEYFVIDISYVNKSSKTLDLWASDVVLVDAEGNEYEANTDVSLAVEDPIIIEEINPGITVTGTLVFEVPPGKEFTELRFEESYGGAEVTINFT